jgi:hypothetical protein
VADRTRRPPRVAGHGRRPLDDRPADRPTATLGQQPAVAAVAVEPVERVERVEPAAAAEPVARTAVAVGPEVVASDAAPVPEVGVTSPPFASDPWVDLSPGAGDVRSGRRRHLDRWVAGLVVLALAAVVLGTVDLVRRYVLTGGTASVDTAQSMSAVTAALNAAGPLTSYDYTTTAATKIAAAKPLVTAGCAASYQKDLTTLAGTLDPLKVVETVSFSSGGVESTGPGTVTVLVFGERTAKDSRSSTPQVSQLQVALTMVRQGKGWLVDGVVSNGSGGSGKPTC